MLAAIVRYADDAAGIEKTLRLLQAICLVLTGLVESAEDVAYWTRLRSQFALGRRYFRLLKWYPCWGHALAAVTSSRAPLTKTLDVGKWTFRGMYLFLEMFTITNALGATSFEWAPVVQKEANKCWFYALIFSILLELLHLSEIPSQSPQVEVADTLKEAVDPAPTPETANGSTTRETSICDNQDSAVKLADEPDTGRQRIWTQLLIDANDLLIPGSALGWIKAGPILVGTASTVSTLLAGQQIWKRVQQSAIQL